MEKDLRSPGFWTEDSVFPYSINRLPSIGKEQKRVSKKYSLVSASNHRILNNSWASNKLRGPMSHLATGLLGTSKQDIHRSSKQSLDEEDLVWRASCRQPQDDP